MKVVCKLDAKIVIDLILLANITIHPLDSLVGDILELKKRKWLCMFQHVSREMNFRND